MKTIFFVSNLRMLLIGLLLGCTNDSTLFIIDDNFRSYFNNLKKKNVFFVKKPNGLFELLFYTFFYHCIMWFKFALVANKKEVISYGADHIIGAKYFLKRYPFFVIEDGSANYDPKSYQRSWKNKLFSIPVFGVHENVKKIYLTQSFDVPEMIKDKVEVIDIKKLWDIKNQEEKKNILNFFNISDEKRNELKKRKFILYTQPLSEDGILTEKEKIEIYTKILSKYDITSLVIKPHPREKTNYSNYFNNVYIFNDSYPSEILDLLDINFDKVITLFSTAILQYPKGIVDFYGVECHPKLKAKFTELNIFEVNCKL